MKSNNKRVEAEAQATNKLRISPAHGGLLYRMPLPVKMVLLTIMIGIFICITLDYIQSKKLRTMFNKQLTERLSKKAMEDSLGFNDYVKAFHLSTNLYMSQSNFSSYINKQKWDTKDAAAVNYYNKPPPWYPDSPVLETLIRPGYVLLFDSELKLKEVYQSRKGPLPASLSKPADLLIKGSSNQGYLTSIDNTPYIVTTRTYVSSSHGKKAILIFASPVDEDFLSAALGKFNQEHLVALISSGQAPYILSSNNPDMLRPGIRMDSLMNSYLITGNEFLNDSKSGLPFKLVSFINRKEIKSMEGAVISKARQERALVGFALIVAFTFVMYWITRHIQQINRSIADFSRQVLGKEPREMARGDHLQILKEQFENITREVIESRDIIKRQAEEKARLIANNSFDAIITADREGVVQLWNSEAENIFGWSQEEAVGRIAADTIIPPQHRDVNLPNAGRIFKSGGEIGLNTQVETIAYHRDGREFPIELSVTQVGTGDNRSLIAVVRDISERKKKEEDLLLFQSLINRSNDAMMIVDPQTGQYLYVNDEACASLEYSRDELLAMRVKDIEAVLTDDFSWYRQAERMRKMNNMILEGSYRRKNGTLFPVEVSVKFIDQGKSSYLVAIVRDVTERKMAEEQIKSALKENKTLLREVHQRVKNNLQIISSFVNLQKGYIKDKEALDIMVECQNRIRAIAIVHEKLHRTEHLTNVNLREYISDMVKSLIELYEIRLDIIRVNINIDYILLDTNTAIPCGLIVNELITNSLQYAFPDGKSGEIYIEIRLNNDEVRIIISDNGIGLSADLKSAESMGLLIVNALLNQFNGKMVIDRNNGTTYNITFRRKL